MELPHSSLKMVASHVVSQLKRFDRHIPALAIASAINERLTDLLSNSRLMDTVSSVSTQRFLMYSEATRRQTFARWPHMDYKWALPNQMAQAGFYHQPSVSGDDRAMCFTCNVCLVCWEKTDEPWSEHERHSPACPFVKGEYTQNVPLALTYATDAANTTRGFSIMSNGNQSNVMATANEAGEITLWKVKRQIRNIGTLRIMDDIKFILTHAVAQDNQDYEYTKPKRVELHSMCTFRSNESLSGIAKNVAKGLKLVCGVTIDGKLYLVVYNVHKSRHKHGSTGENSNDSKDTSSTQHTAGCTKKSSLKSIVLEEQYEDDLLPSAVDPNLLYDNWIKVTDSDSDSIYIKDESGGNINSDNNFGYYNETQEMSTNATGKNGKNAIITELVEMPTTSAATYTNDFKSIWGIALQSIPVTPILCGSYNITDIIPSYDHKYMLVIMRKANAPVSDDMAEKMEVDDDETDDTVNAQLFVFEINEKGFLSSTPIESRVLFEDHVPIQICMLPNYNNTSLSEDSSEASNSTADTQNGVFVMVCADGTLQMIALTSLRTISETSVAGKFVSVTYCKNLERVCACTRAGVLHFYSFFDIDMDSADEQDDEKMNCLVSDTSLTGFDHEVSEIDGLSAATMAALAAASVASTSTSPITLNFDPTAAGSCSPLLYAHRHSLTLNDLKVLYSLTLFDEMLTSYTAEVPACWNEMAQAQKQRKHSQNQRPGDDIHLMKSWRLHNDA